MNSVEYTYSLSDTDQTDIQLVSSTNPQTGVRIVTALSDKELQLPSVMAFAGARYSRSSDSIQDILKEIKSAGSNAQEKLASIFRNYGHASVADMANIFIYIEHIPQMYAFKFFYETSIGGGQERSTRYQDFGGSNIHDLKDKANIYGVDGSEKDYAKVNQLFRNIQSMSLEFNKTWVDRLTQEYTEVYQIDSGNKRQVSALKARVFDSARGFLLSGINNTTSLAWVTSAREWGRIISAFKAESDPGLQALAVQLEDLLAPHPDIAQELGYIPEAPDLIRYTSADETTTHSLGQAKELVESIFSKSNTDTRKDLHHQTVSLQEEYASAGIKTIAQYILTLKPELNYLAVCQQLGSVEKETLKKLSTSLFSGFNHHKQMGNQARTNQLSFNIEMSIAEARDLNRHRAWGRFSPLLSNLSKARNLLSDGYVMPLYLSENLEFSKKKAHLDSSVRDAFCNDMDTLYQKLSAFFKLAETYEWFPQELLAQLLPFAHKIQYNLHGSIKELSYISHLRVRPGGHINYRDIAYQMCEQASKQSPELSGLMFEAPRPDPSSSEEFVDRS